MKKLRLSGLFVFTLLLMFSTDLVVDASAAVTVDRDDKGVWFISGPDDEPLSEVFRAMGHAVATDRLWQMELYRRTATGRMSEIFGTDFVETDTFMRTLGYSDEELNEAFAGMDQEPKDMIQGYVAGINQRLAEIAADQHLLPFEFAALGLMPEPWTVDQVLAWTAVMQRNFDPEALDTGQLDNASLLAGLTEFAAVNFDNPDIGFAMFNDLRWSNDPAAPSVIDHAPPCNLASNAKASSKLKLDPRAVASKLKEKHDNMLASLEKVNARVKMGSYAWVISGDKTKSGNPIIYSGPQMGFSVPSIVLEGSIRAGGLNISGMSVPGLPGIVIGRTPHHAWSMQVGHAHTTDYYFEHISAVTGSRNEVIKVAGGEDIELQVLSTDHGPVVDYNPSTGMVVTWKYAHRNHEFDSIDGFLKLARATSMDEFGDGIRELGVSQHFCYADRDGNIAYWMSGWDPVREPSEWRLPQGAIDGVYGEWTGDFKPLSTDRNTTRGWYGGWNNKSSADYSSGYNGVYTTYGPFHRTHVIYDYLDRKLRRGRKLGFNQIRDLALFIATTDSFYGGGNPWKFVKKDFSRAVLKAGFSWPRWLAVYKLNRWDGHFVDGGRSQWVAGTERAEAWVLMDRWIDEVIKMTFSDELAVDGKLRESNRVLFNVLLHGLDYPGSLTNNYNWFQNLTDSSAPQDAPAIIVAALDKVLAEWDSLPPETFERGFITYNHDIIGPVHVEQTPKSSRSTYAHCIEYGSNGPVRIESMFPLGESGNIGYQLTGNPANPIMPVFDDHFFSMTPAFDSFAPREFPLF